MWIDTKNYELIIRNFKYTSQCGWVLCLRSLDDLGFLSLDLISLHTHYLCTRCDFPRRSCSSKFSTQHHRYSLLLSVLKPSVFHTSFLFLEVYGTSILPNIDVIFPPIFFRQRTFFFDRSFIQIQEPNSTLLKKDL